MSRADCDTSAFTYRLVPRDVAAYDEPPRGKRLEYRDIKSATMRWSTANRS